MLTYPLNAVFTRISGTSTVGILNIKIYKHFISKLLSTNYKKIKSFSF